MTTCKKFVEKLSEYLDGYLNSPDNMKIEEHLKNCPNCNNEFQQIRDLKNSLSSLPKHKTSPHFEPILYAKLRSNKNQSFNLFSNLNFKLKVPIYVGAAAILLLTGLFIGQNGISGTPFAKTQNNRSSARFQDENTIQQQTPQIPTVTQANQQVALKKSNNVIYF